MWRGVGSIMLCGTLLLTGFPRLTAGDSRAPEPPGGDEFKRLIPHVDAVCAVVRESPAIWPFRSFPYGPLGLEVRKAKSATEADGIRNFYLGVVAAACRIPRPQVTAFFFCGPDCPANRRDHLVRQLAAVRTLAHEFERLSPIRLLAVWAPEGELRINDVFLLRNQPMEAIPSPNLGFVPSGEWKPWPSLEAYLSSVKISEQQVRDLTRQMMAIGLSAVIREPSGTRLVGVGIGDNESGLIFLHSAASSPRIGTDWPDGRQYTIIEEVAPRVFYYETT